MRKKQEESTAAESISARKWKQIKSEAADLGITPEEHLIHKVEKEMLDLQRKYSISLTKSQQIAALNWAAEKEHTTYGKLVSSLSTSDKVEIYHQYEEYLVEQQKIDEEKTKELRAIVKKIKRRTND